MDQLDRAILDAWGKRKRGRATPQAAMQALRSWALTIRAGDRRWIPGRPLDDLAPGEHTGGRVKVNQRDDVFGGAPGSGCIHPGRMEVIELTGVEARGMCRAIRIDPPGIPIAAAAERFGVGINTIRRWEKRGIVRIERLPKRASDLEHDDPWTAPPYAYADRPPHPRRRPRWNVCWVTTRGYVDPGGEVWSMPWGAVRRMLADAIPDDWSQTLVRARRPIGAQCEQWQWRCPCCGAWAFKLYWPTPHVTVPRWIAQMTGGGRPTSTAKPQRGQTSNPHHWRGALCPSGQSVADHDAGFSCRRCAALVYESAERTSHKHGRSVDVWHRFIGRISEGQLRGDQVRI